jgi:RNA 3'-terminal phosphate cyclase (ATP)
VLQAVLPALLTAPGPSRLILEGGTHNPFAPSFDFLQKAFLPILARMGPEFRAEIDRPGFYPVGGGRFSISIRPTEKLEPIDLPERGSLRRQTARAVVARLPRHIAERELGVIRGKLGLEESCLAVEEVPEARGPGNVVSVEVQSEHLTEVFTGFGERGVKAETVAAKVAEEAREYLAADIPVGRHLADQLLLPFALAGGGSFKTLALTPHSLTNIDVIKLFCDVEVQVTQCGEQAWLVSLERR